MISETASWKETPWGKVSWTDIQDPTQGDIDALAKKHPNFHPLNLQDCLSNRQLMRVEDHDSYLFILLHFPTVRSDGRVDRNQLSVFVGEGFAVTLHGTALAVRQISGPAEDDEGQIPSVQTPASLVYAVVDSLVDEVFPILDKVRDDLDGIEDEVFDENVSATRQINSLRREIADLSRITKPYRSTLNDASGKLMRFGSKDLAPYFRDVLDHVDKVAETLDGASETIEIYKDTNFLQNTDRTNRVLGVLTIIFTLTIPAAVIAAIFGMNVALPLGNGQNPPTFLGPYTSFIILVAAMAIPAGLMGLYFKHLGWY